MAGRRIARHLRPEKYAGQVTGQQAALCCNGRPCISHANLPGTLVGLVSALVFLQTPLARAQDKPDVPGGTFRDCPECPEMVPIPAGNFVMGSHAREVGRDGDEGPQHEVRVGTFALSRYEVTLAEYKAFVRDTGFDTSGCTIWAEDRWTSDQAASWRNPGFGQTERQPVVCVSWTDAQAYVVWLSGKTGHAYRLPSEAEWEYAARARTTTARYWGESPDSGCTYSNVADRSLRERYPDWVVDQGEKARYPEWIAGHACEDGYVYTAPVSSFEPNAFGLHDMLGNVWEWVEDCWNASYVGAPEDGSAWTSGDCSHRVARGGGWDDFRRFVRSANRARWHSQVRAGGLGFRVARTLE